MRTERPPESYEEWVRTAQAANASGSVDELPRRIHHMMRMIIALVQDAVVTLSKKSARAVLQGSGDGLCRDEVDAFMKKGGAKSIVSAAAGADEAGAAGAGGAGASPSKRGSSKNLTGAKPTPAEDSPAPAAVELQ